jgi:beta-glucanase (GH16 family)
MNIQYYFLKLVDNIITLYYNIKNWCLYKIFKTKSLPYKINLPLTLNLDFTKLQSIDEHFRKGQPWGDYHPGKLLEWYDPNAVNLTSNGLELSITENTKVVDGGTIPYGVGLVTSKKGFGYGVYQWKVILPKGSALWPAVWLAGEITWPPEIDVIEAYSNELGEYKNRLNTNIHLGSSGDNHYQLIARSHGSYIEEGELLLKLDWNKDYIKIYYNGFLCRVVKNHYDLMWFNQDQIVIMNMALNNDYIDKVTYDDIAKTPFIIKYFNFYSY